MEPLVALLLQVIGLGKETPFLPTYSSSTLGA